jgi:hypothetical protein
MVKMREMIITIISTVLFGLIGSIGIVSNAFIDEFNGFS